MTTKAGMKRPQAVVVGADGFYSQVAKLVEPQTEDFEPVHRAMYYSYFQNLPPHDPVAAEHYFRGDHLVYVFPTDADLTMISITVPISEFDAYRKDAKGEMMSVLKTLPDLAPRLAICGDGSANKRCGQHPVLFACALRKWLGAWSGMRGLSSTPGRVRVSTMPASMQ
jgi:flavin-dependent dehydrogenase